VARSFTHSVCQRAIQTPTFSFNGPATSLSPLRSASCPTSSLLDILLGLRRILDGWIAQTRRRRCTFSIPNKRCGLLRLRPESCSIVGDDPSISFADFFKQVFAYVDKNRTAGLVLDLRMNGGGDNSLTPIVTSGILQRPELNTRGRLFVIIGRATQSAAENLVNRLERDTNAVFVGEPTGERPNMYGDPQTFVLPNNRLQVHIASLYWQDMGPRDHRDTTGPEIAAELTEDDYERGIDPAMEAIERDPGPSFSDIVLKSASVGGRAIAEAYRDYLVSPIHRFYQVERPSEDLIDTLVDRKNLDAAQALAFLNLGRFGTADAYDALAEVYEARGDTIKARDAYRKALATDRRDAVAAAKLTQL
jgi:hypothetical protein